MRKMDKFDREASRIVGVMKKQYKKVQGVNELSNHFWIRMWDEIHMSLRSYCPNEDPGPLTDFAELLEELLDK